MKINKILVAIGSNIEPRQKNINEAKGLIRSNLGSILAEAPVYETKPQGSVATHNFLNTAVIVQTDLTPHQALQALQGIETSMGRIRKDHWGDRNIDLDIILFMDSDNHNITFNNSELTIPHPLALDRDFVLVPACEIAADWLHPLTNNTLKEELDDRKYSLISL